MTSGQMWSHIRSPPLMHRSAKGISYIHSGSSGQFIIETYIIFTISKFHQMEKNFFAYVYFLSLTTDAAITIGLILLVESMKSGSKLIDQKKKKCNFFIL